MEYEYSPMQLAEVTDFSFLKDWDTIRIMPEGYDEVIEPIRVLQDSDLIETDEGQPYQYCEASFRGVESKKCPRIMYKGDQVIKKGDDLYCIHCLAVGSDECEACDEDE